MREPGDYKLTNGEVVAGIRKRDGKLTEYWRTGLILPTTPQLGAQANMDSLWELSQVLHLGKRKVPLRVMSVASRSDAVVVRGAVPLGSGKLEVETLYRLAATGRRLEILSRVMLVGKQLRPSRIRLGDALRWGNVQYYVDTLPSPRMKHRGRVAWIGRRGAGGDLVLRPADAKTMHVEYTAKRRGFQSTIYATHFDGVISPSKGISFRRYLAFEPLPRRSKLIARSRGELRLQVRDESGRDLPAKIKFDRLGHPGPLFDDDGDLDGSFRFGWTGNGRYQRELPPGRYRLLVTSGPERVAHEATVDVVAGRVSSRSLTLKRAFGTPGWVAADLHLHQAPSVDADISLPQRVVSVVAEGVEAAVATDHYVVTDLKPTVERLRQQGVLSAPLISLRGCEVSTVGRRFGHFNVFPLAPGARIVHRDTTPTKLFRDARRKSPRGLIQVNHPRWDPALGYFSYFGIDDASGTMSRSGYDPNFDAIEVYNGDDARDLKRVKRVFRDYMNLLAKGNRYVATGSSDSHKLAFLDPGLPRTMVRVGDIRGDDADRKISPRELVAALRAGRAMVTSGPMLFAQVQGQGPGGRVRFRGSTELELTVLAAPWVDVTTVEVWVGPPVRRLSWFRVPRSKKPRRFHKKIRLSRQRPGFVIATAQGERALRNVAQEGTRPFAFTNPIWLEPTR